MKIKVKPWGIFQDIIGGRELIIDISARATVGDLLNELTKRYGVRFEDELFLPNKKKIRPYIKILLNGHGVDLRAKLNDGDSVAIFPPVGGG
ncbi:MAG: MoaD family protein [Candidatus Hodarchaeaceae archaeon]|nr:MoaD family protein [Candidatus Hodarchaeaceae archaeon]